MLVLERLRQEGIWNLPNRRANPNNYRLHEPPYGFRKQEGRLVPYKPELKICRIVVRMYEREKQTYSAIARELEVQGYKNRRGEKRWSHDCQPNLPSMEGAIMNYVSLLTNRSY